MNLHEGSSIPSASHAGGPGFESLRAHHHDKTSGGFGQSQGKGCVEASGAARAFLTGFRAGLLAQSDDERLNGVRAEGAVDRSSGFDRLMNERERHDYLSQSENTKWKPDYSLLGKI